MQLTKYAKEWCPFIFDLEYKLYVTSLFVFADLFHIRLADQNHGRDGENQRFCNSFEFLPGSFSTVPVFNQSRVFPCTTRDLQNKGPVMCILLSDWKFFGTKLKKNWKWIGDFSFLFSAKTFSVWKSIAHDPALILKVCLWLCRGKPEMEWKILELTI